MNGMSLKILMIEDDMDFAQIVRMGLINDPAWPIDVSFACTMAEALEKVSTNNINAILLDLSLPDSNGLDTFTQVRLFAQHIPIVVLSANRDFWVAIQSVRGGAQDYLLKGEVNGPLLARALYYAVERNHFLETLRRLSLLDELTGVYNRRGLLSLAEQHVSLAKRTNRSLVIVYADVDGLKRINDEFGHAAGDEALVRTAQVLRKTFRRSDIIGRIGGDEFVVVAIDTCREKTETILSRLALALEEDNAHEELPYHLSLTAGTQEIDMSCNISLEEWIAKADQALYEKKHSRK